MTTSQVLRDHQMWLHFVALGLLLGAVMWPALAKPAGAAFAASCARLGWNLRGAMRVFVRVRDRIGADGEHRAP
jgi:hypothetical protein